LRRIGWTNGVVVFPWHLGEKSRFFWGEKKKRGADVYFNSEVLEYLGDKISNSPRLSLGNGYDVKSLPLILSPIEFSRFHCENKLTLPCSICRPTNIENICGKCKSRYKGQNENSKSVEIGKAVKMQ
jgi:hypothetical protein